MYYFDFEIQLQSFFTTYYNFFIDILFSSIKNLNALVSLRLRVRSYKQTIFTRVSFISEK